MNTSGRKGLARLAWRPGYEGDEVALGIALAFALHAIPIAAMVLKALYPSADVDEQPLVAKPVIGATLLKLGTPIDPKKLPDRIIPKARTAPRDKVVASREEPQKKNEKPDAGPPPPDTKEADLQRLIAKTEPFAEEPKKEKPEEGALNGVQGATETDPSKVHAGDMYAAKLGIFFHERWQYPTVISQGEANKLCVTFQVAINPKMSIWHVQQSPAHPSGNELFDDSARSMLQKLMDDHTALPEPPPEVAESFKGRTVQIALSGDLHGDSSKCR